MIYLPKAICVRIDKEVLEEIYNLLDKYPDNYPHRSQFIRVAVNKLLAEEKDENKRIKSN